MAKNEPQEQSLGDLAHRQQALCAPSVHLQTASGFLGHYLGQNLWKTLL